MKRTLIFIVGAALAVSGGLLSGQTVPTIQFDFRHRECAPISMSTQTKTDLRPGC